MTTTFPAAVRDDVRSMIKARYATIFTPAHILAFHLDPPFVRFRHASRVSQVKPYTRMDAAMCMEATKRLVRTASVPEHSAVLT